MHSKNRDRWLLGIMGIGFIAAGAIHGQMQFNPAFQQALYQPVVGILAILLALLPTITFVLWGNLPGKLADRKRFMIAAVIGGAFTTFFQGFAVLVGWYRGPAFAAPIFVQAFVYGATLLLTITLPMLLYRWLSPRHFRVAVAVYALIVLFLCLATVVGDQTMLASGGFVFANGYTIGSDVLYALVIYGLPFAVYHWPHKSADQPAH